MGRRFKKKGRGGGEKEKAEDGAIREGEATCESRERNNGNNGPLLF